jgi:hypothetical protein
LGGGKKEVDLNEAKKEAEHATFEHADNTTTFASSKNFMFAANLKMQEFFTKIKNQNPAEKETETAVDITTFIKFSPNEKALNQLAALQKSKKNGGNEGITPLKQGDSSYYKIAQRLIKEQLVPANIDVNQLTKDLQKWNNGHIEEQSLILGTGKNGHLIDKNIYYKNPLFYPAPEQNHSQRWPAGHSNNKNSMSIDKPMPTRKYIIDQIKVGDGGNLDNYPPKTINIEAINPNHFTDTRPYDNSVARDNAVSDFQNSWFSKMQQLEGLLTIPKGAGGGKTGGKQPAVTPTKLPNSSNTNKTQGGSKNSPPPKKQENKAATYDYNPLFTNPLVKEEPVKGGLQPANNKTQQANTNKPNPEPLKGGLKSNEQKLNENVVKETTPNVVKAIANTKNTGQIKGIENLIKGIQNEETKENISTLVEIHKNSADELQKLMNVMSAIPRIKDPKIQEKLFDCLKNAKNDKTPLPDAKQLGELTFVPKAETITSQKVVSEKIDKNPDYTYLDTDPKIRASGLQNTRAALPEERLAAEGKIKTFEEQAKKNKESIKGKNLGYIEGQVTLDGKMVGADNAVQTSVSEKEFDNSAELTKLRNADFFDTKIVDKGNNIYLDKSDAAWSRHTDSEYLIITRFVFKIQEHFPNFKFKKGEIYKHITGNLKIISTNPYCISCQDVIKQFNKSFPNINLILVDNVRKLD